MGIDSLNKSKLKISLSWSGGKDSAYALWKLQQDPDYVVSRLHTTFGETSKRVGMHGIHESLIEKQAEAIGLPLDKIYYPASGDNQAYEKAMNAYLDKLESEAIYHIAYGDIFLEDLKKYRENQLATRGFEGVFPLWGKDTEVLAEEFINSGFKTLICAADADKIDKAWVGKIFDRDFLTGLTQNIDPCGENGEFHTFCYEGPIFSDSIAVVLKEKISNTYKFENENGIKVEKRYWFQEIALKTT